MTQVVLPNGTQVVAHGTRHDDNNDGGRDPYEVPKEMGIFREIPSEVAYISFNSALWPSRVGCVVQATGSNLDRRQVIFRSASDRASCLREIGARSQYAMFRTMCNSSFIPLDGDGGHTLTPFYGEGLTYRIYIASCYGLFIHGRR